MAFSLARCQKSTDIFPEEEPSRQPSLFSMVRAVVDMFAIKRDPQLGLCGAFGYDLTFQFESIRLAKERPESQRDKVLYLPDRMLVVDQDKRSAWRLHCDFAWDGQSTVCSAVVIGGCVGLSVIFGVCLW